MTVRLSVEHRAAVPQHGRRNPASDHGGDLTALEVRDAAPPPSASATFGLQLALTSMPVHSNRPITLTELRLGLSHLVRLSCRFTGSQLRRSLQAAACWASPLTRRDPLLLSKSDPFSKHDSKPRTTRAITLARREGPRGPAGSDSGNPCREKCKGSAKERKRLEWEETTNP